jgi:hypothetical protein
MLSLLSRKLSQQVSFGLPASCPPTMISFLEQSLSSLYAQFVTVHFKRVILKSPFSHRLLRLNVDKRAAVPYTLSEIQQLLYQYQEISCFLCMARTAAADKKFKN